MSCGKSVIPYGFKTVVETLGKTVLLKQPTDIHQFASVYFQELLEFRADNPTLDLKELVSLFYVKKVITEDPEKRTVSEPEELAGENDQNVTLPCNMFVPIDQKACFPIKSPSSELAPVMHEDLMPKGSLPDPSINKSNTEFKREIDEEAAEDKPCFVYLYTSSTDRDESAFAYICPDAASVKQEDIGNIECEPAHIEVATPQMTEKGAHANCKLVSNEFNSIPILTRIQQTQVYNSTNRKASVHKSRKTTRKSASFPETPSVNRAFSSDMAVIQKPIHQIHKAVPIHSEAVSTYTENFPVLPTDLSVLDNYKQYLISLERDSYPIEVATANKEFGQKNSLAQIVDATPGDHKKHLEKCNSRECSLVLETRRIKREMLGKSCENFQNTKKTDVNETHTNKMEYVKETGVYETVNGMQDMESISTPSQSDRCSENDFSPPAAYCSCNQASKLLDVQMLHSETQQESLNIMTEVFHKLFIRLGDLEFRVQDLISRLEDLTITVNEIHSAMNITTTGDSFHYKTSDQHENYFQN
ncbi:calcium-binding tyrosine phosphorylation-regulated protein-like isoform X2 [Pristis pectinata]|uniref:calcium-binding tyrosine phosphorylation-regulated protein-like isoform X2 n=1 Tax=Pristis pectinata TaxID=685728 RepID=UPI00223D1B51|nr:calcium-binding tyrosine phosphorylation-regulated protein-like isoform X2 [Pristis pectinata]